ncbi:MAG: hypothetical protein U0105_00250 [Candidatus Obscuribacterales bacterium]
MGDPVTSARKIAPRLTDDVVKRASTIGILLAGFVASPAVAQVAPPTTTTPAPRVDLPNVQAPTGTTILPTDTLPAQSLGNRMTVGENLQLRLLQALPARLYLTGTAETSVRVETNVFQFPTKRNLITTLPQGNDFFRLSASQKNQVSSILALASREDTVFRILPNVTAGWTFTPRTRAYVNYFFLRDSLAHNIRLNTNINSVTTAVQHDFPIGSRSNVQVEMQFRDLWQTNQLPLFDFLPGITATRVLTTPPNTVVFANCLLQLRGTGYFKSPNREIDPFYTWGMVHQRGGWTFSATSTFVQNFREPFREHATIAKNNYTMISDFEIARRLFRQIPGFQVFARAEPIWNMKAGRTPGLSGMDFRMYFGMRVSAAKQALTSTLEQLRQQIEEQENTPTPPKPVTPAPSGKPSAMADPYQLIAHDRQPIHGFMPEHGQGLPADASASIVPALVGWSPNQNYEQDAFPERQADPVSNLPAITTPSAPITKEANVLGLGTSSATPAMSMSDIEYAMTKTMSHPVLVGEETREPRYAEPVFDAQHMAGFACDEENNLGNPVARIAVSRTISASKKQEPSVYLVPPLPTVDVRNKQQPFGSDTVLARPTVLQTLR